MIKSKMKTIRCCCGMELLVVPDLKAMTHVIKEHAAKHWNSIAVVCDLSKQVLDAASADEQS